MPTGAGGDFPDGGTGMTYWTAILLGLIQGLAEFLPISSSGHLAILQNFLRIGDLENQMLFDVLLHLGTLGAVIFAYHTELRGLCREGLMMLHLQKPKRGARQDPARRRLLLFLIAATLPLIPAAFLSDYLDSLFYDTFFIGFALIATGFLLLAADRYGHGNKTEKAMTLSDALVIGLAQMIAVVPGLSRSGTTISAGMLRGFDRTFAVKFSFFLSIPAVLGANLLSLVKAISAGINWADVEIVVICRAGIHSYGVCLSDLFIKRRHFYIVSCDVKKYLNGRKCVIHSPIYKGLSVFVFPELVRICA